MSDFCALAGMLLFNNNSYCCALIVTCNWCNRNVCIGHSVTIQWRSSTLYGSTRCDECIAQNKLVNIRGQHISARDQIMSCIVEYCIEIYPTMIKAIRVSKSGNF